MYPIDNSQTNLSTFTFKNTNVQDSAKRLTYKNPLNI
jgi:hypothetical protein